MNLPLTARIPTDSKLNHLGGCSKDQPDPMTYDPYLWDKLITDFNIKSIIDIGCGEGYSLKYFIDKGIKSIGIEGYKEAIDNSRVKDYIIYHDYTNGPYILNDKYDAIWCCEFVEHIDEKYMSNFLETYKCAKYIFMTHATPGQSGHHHVNEQNAIYWINKLNSINYKFLDNYTQETKKYLTKNTWMKYNFLSFIHEQI